jgi:uncharacterized protein YuzE
MEKFNFDYDSENDDLFVYLENKKSAGAVELGNFVLDFDKEGDLVAMQIINASEVFSKVLSKMIKLSKITEVKVEIINFRNMEAIKFSVSDSQVEEKTTLLIPHIKEKSPALQY